MRVKHWQDPLNGLLGIWLIISPWVLGFTGTGRPMATTIVAGIILLASSIIAMATPHAWEEWVDTILGILLIISPYALRFAGEHAARENAVICGIVMIVLSLWVLGTDQQFGWGHRSAA
jgi:hypothetical protein